MTLTAIAALVVNIAEQCTEPATFDMLAEEVLELHLAQRGQHADPEAMEWLEIATIAVRALATMYEADVQHAAHKWRAKHSNEWGLT